MGEEEITKTLKDFLLVSSDLEGLIDAMQSMGVEWLSLLVASLGTVESTANYILRADTENRISALEAENFRNKGEM